MTHIFSPKPKEMAKWKSQATQAAQHLKRIAFAKEELVIAFAYDDAIAKVHLSREQVNKLSVDELADAIYQSVLKAVRGELPNGSLH